MIMCFPSVSVPEMKPLPEPVTSTQVINAKENSLGGGDARLDLARQTDRSKAARRYGIGKTWITDRLVGGVGGDEEGFVDSPYGTRLRKTMNEPKE